MNKPLRFAYDTEFLEDGRTIELISIGIVCEDGREYYAVNSDMPVDRIKKDDWLLRNVVRHLPIVGVKSLEKYLKHPENRFPRPSVELVDIDRTDTRVKPHWVIRNEVREFLAFGDEGGPKAELWADYGAYDHVALAQLFGRMIDLPEWVPMYTNDLQQELRRVGSPELPKQADALHNALADARHLMQCLQHLEQNGSPNA